MRRRRPIFRAGLGGVVLLALVAAYYTFGGPSRLSERQEGLHQMSFEGRRRSLITAFPGLVPGADSVVAQFLTPAPELDVGGAWRAGPFVVSPPTAPDRVTVRYTLDGSVPGPRSPEFGAPFIIDSTVVLRVRSFSPWRLPSEVVTRSLFVGDSSSIPALALTTDPANLWNEFHGLYENPSGRGKGWERAAHVEYFPEGDSRAALSFPARLRIHGNWSRQLPKKSFRIQYSVPRAEGGAHLFLNEPGPRDRREAVIRSGASNYRWRLFDDLFNVVYREMGGLTSERHPVNLFLNGDYWGVYNLREHVDEEFLLRNVGPGVYDLVETRACFTPGFRSYYACFVPLAGDLDHWWQTVKFFQEADLTQPEALGRAEELVDLDNLVDYWIMNVYADNRDWPISNVLAYRSRDGSDGRWRWIAWDADNSFNVYADDSLTARSLVRSLEPGPRPDLEVGARYEGNWRGTLFMRKLLENEHFRDRFVMRFLDLLNTNLRHPRVEGHLDALLGEAPAATARDRERWNTSAEDAEERARRIREFISGRAPALRRQMQAYFGLDTEREITTDVVPGERGWSGSTP